MHDLPTWSLPILEILLCIVHLALVIFNIIGWMYPGTRRWHLLTILATAFAWFGLGLFFGIGYCPLTDWQWSLRRQMGYYDMPNSFIKFVADKTLGINSNAVLIDILTATGFFVSLFFAVLLNIRDYRSHRKHT